MAFCAACGTKLNENARFCPSCGTNVAAGAGSISTGAGSAAAPARAPIAYSPMPPPPPPVRTVPAPGKKKGGALKVVLIIAGVLVVLAIIAAGVFGYGVYKAKQAMIGSSPTASESSTATTPVPATSPASPAPSDNTAPVNQQMAANMVADMGVVLYPGATARGNASAASVEFESGDSIIKVTQFYVDKYPDGVFTSTDPRMASLVVTTDKGMVSMVVNSEDGGRSSFRISRSAGAPLR
jgi:hypothetical protein